MVLGKTFDGGFFARILCWLKGQIISDVPAKDAVCEFECRKRQCSYGEWADCSRRLKYIAKN
jgi:hypothetical protein